jgi:probable O-glycosylation ligase (exosortase A-associated)
LRDILVVTVFCIVAFYALRRPFVGTQLYNWISIMNPHRLGWGFAYGLPLAMVASGVTLVGLVRSPGEFRLPRDRNFVLMLALWGFVTVTTIFAFYPADARVVWEGVTKTFLMALLACGLLTTQRRVMAFVVAIAAFVGFYGVKGAVFSVMTGGNFKVWGPPGSALEDNNAVGLALVMIVPFCFFLRSTLSKRWHSLALLVIGLASIVSATLTYSRGALIGLATFAVFSWLFAKRKVVVAVVLALTVMGGMSVLPQQWFDRMNTIQNFEGEGSAQMRLNSWRTSFNLAKANPLGGGFDCFTMEQYYNYSPNPELGRTKSGVASTAHSIYFEVMAMHGFGGLALYLVCLLSMFSALLGIGRRARGHPQADWIVPYCRAFLVAFLGFLACAAFQSKAFFDLFWMLYAGAIGFCVVARAALHAELGASDRVESPGPALERSVAESH